MVCPLMHQLVPFSLFSRVSESFAGGAGSVAVEQEHLAALWIPLYEHHARISASVRHKRPRPPGEEALYKYPTLRVG